MDDKKQSNRNEMQSWWQRARSSTTVVLAFMYFSYQILTSVLRAVSHNVNSPALEYILIALPFVAMALVLVIIVKDMRTDKADREILFPICAVASSVAIIADIL